MSRRKTGAQRAKEIEERRRDRMLERAERMSPGMLAQRSREVQRVRLKVRNRVPDEVASISIIVKPGTFQARLRAVLAKLSEWNAQREAAGEDRESADQVVARLVLESAKHGDLIPVPEGGPEKGDTVLVLE